MNNKLIYLAVTTIVFALGCGQSGPQKFPVSGEVSYKGSPIPNGSVTFAPKGGGDIIVVAIDDGAYELEAPVADYEVGVTALAEIAEGKEGFEQKVTRSTLPNKFSHPSRSGIVATVEETDLNIVDLELK